MADHSHTAPPSDPELRIKALESLPVEKGLIDPVAVDDMIEARTKRRAAQWRQGRGSRMDRPGYKHRLIQDAPRRSPKSVLRPHGEHMVAVENRPKVHNLVVCTLCSCYPWPILGLPPVWYKSAAYRSRAVIDPRGVLPNSARVAEDVEVRVWDSNAELRYIVLPKRPAGTDGWSEEKLAACVTRDAMIGTAVVAPPA